MNTYQLWEGLSAESLGILAQLQWEKYGTKLKFITMPAPSLDKGYAFSEVEDIQEIDKLMRQTPRKGTK